MTAKRDLKRRVRERQGRTGESYMTAMRQVLDQRPSVVPVVEMIELSEVGAAMGIQCRVRMAPVLADRIDAVGALRRLRDALITTERDPAFDLMRRVVSRFPYPFKYIVSQIIAAAIYFPLARFALILEGLSVSVSNMPLSIYRKHSFYTMRTDALDRFSTRLEHRFTKGQIEEMLSSAGLGDISFGETPPYWCAIGYKAHAKEAR